MSATNAPEANLPKKADTETDEDLSPEMARQEERKNKSRRIYSRNLRPANTVLSLYVPRHGIGTHNCSRLLMRNRQEPRGFDEMTMRQMTVGDIPKFGSITLAT